MNTAKLVNSALTGGGLIYPENLNVIIGSESKGYPKGYVLDANATLSLAENGGGNGSQSVSQDLGIKNLNYNIEKALDNKDVFLNNVVLESEQYNRKNLLFYTNDQPPIIPLISGSGNIVSGYYNYIRSFNSIILGKTAFAEGFYNIFNSRQTSISLVENTENNKLRIKARENSQIIELLKKGLLYVLSQMAIKGDKVQANTKSVKAPIKLTNYTRISNDIIQLEDDGLESLKDYDKIIIAGIYGKTDSSIVSGTIIQAIDARNSISVGQYLKNEDVDGKYPNSYQVFGLLNTVKNNYEFACGARNVSTKNNNFQTGFSVGAGTSPTDYKNAFEIGFKRSGQSDYNVNTYVLGIGNYDGKNAADDNTKSLQQVISDIETAVSLNSNGPWDVDITSEFVNGNVTIKPLSMWSISQGVKRVYFTANLKQGDVITIPDTLRMYIGWKISDNRFGMADWNAAGKKYTVTTDSNYVILVATANDNPGVQTNNLPSFGKVMLRTSNPEFKPTAQTDAKKDHTNDDKVMRGIAHQGFHKLERANSLAAFRAAAKEGWRYVETDTYMTTDGKFIVSHDPYLPTGWTNGTVTTTQGSYKYEEHTLAEILAFHGPNNEKTDTLEEFCKTCKECGLHPYIELKQGKMADTNTLDTNPRYNGKGYGVKVLDIVNRYGLRGNATFIASVPFTLLRMAREDQSYRYGIVYFGQLKNSDAAWTTVLSKIDEYNNDAVASKAYLFLDANINNLKVADADAVDKLVQKNCAIEVWTATTKDDLDNLDPYVTGVTSDNIHAGEILAKKI